MKEKHELVFVILIFIILGCKPPQQTETANQNVTNQNSNSTQQIKQCDLKIEQAPAIKGFRLGMTFADVKKIIPQVKEAKPDDFGYSRVFLADSKAEDGVPSESINVKDLGSLMVELTFLKGNIISVNSYNPRGVAGLDIATYRSRVEDTLQLPKKLEEDPESTQYYSLTCEGFKVKVGDKSILYQQNWLPNLYWFNSVEDIEATKKLESQRKQAEIELENKKKKEKENIANTFKP